MIHTSLNLIHERKPCDRIAHVEEWRGDRNATELFPFASLLDVPGLDHPGDALWALRCVPASEQAAADRIARLFACDCAERAFLRERSQDRELDPRSWKSIEVARRFATGEATRNELAAAWDAARDAAGGADGAAERQWQSARLRELLTNEEVPA